METSFVQVVIWYSNYKMPGSVSALLLYRSICDLGISIRFLFSPMIANQVCNSSVCRYDQYGNKQPSSFIEK
jgi:hypothetical protein